MLEILAIYSSHHDVVLSGLLEKLWQTRNESKLLGYLREIFLARSILKATPLKFLLMRCLLRRGYIRWQLVLGIEIVISIAGVVT